jgi:hypothetical protein
MKKYLLVLICAVFLIPFAGCKKKSFDPTVKSRTDFTGNWQGIISTFKNNQLLKESGTIVIYPDATGGTMSGVIFMAETYVMHEFQFVDGTLYFNIENSDPGNPECQNWSLGGFMTFVADNEVEIHITGNECGAIGNEFVNWVGNIRPAQVPADSVKYFNFAKSGNSWTYQTFLKNGDSCQLQKSVNEVPSTYQFNGTTSQTCGWPGQNIIFKWNVTPAAFNSVIDSTISDKPLALNIDAKPGVTYNTYINNDTSTVVLLDTNYVLSTPAGTFNCLRYKFTEPVYTGVQKTIRTSYLWLDNRYGIIKLEVMNPLDSTDVQLQVLSAKNF